MKPASSALPQLLRLLLLLHKKPRDTTVTGSALHDRTLNELSPTANPRTGRNKPVHVGYPVLLQNPLEGQQLEVPSRQNHRPPLARALTGADKNIQHQTHTGQPHPTLPPFTRQQPSKNQYLNNIPQDIYESLLEQNSAHSITLSKPRTKKTTRKTNKQNQPSGQNPPVVKS